MHLSSCLWPNDWEFVHTANLFFGEDDSSPPFPVGKVLTKLFDLDTFIGIPSTEWMIGLGFYEKSPFPSGFGRNEPAHWLICGIHWKYGHCVLSRTPIANDANLEQRVYLLIKFMIEDLHVAKQGSTFHVRQLNV